MPVRRIIRTSLFAVVVYLCFCSSPTESKLKKKNYIPDLIYIDDNLQFTMGCIDSLGFICVHRDVIPPFKAILSPYFIGKYEVRNDEYNYFVSDSGYSKSIFWSTAGWDYILAEKRIRPLDWIEGETPWINSNLSNKPDKPINSISWFEAEAYCNWLSYKTSEHFALPTEAQWERAARGPDPGRIFTYGNEHAKDKYNHILSSGQLFVVGSFPYDKSFDGCYDMAGNLLELCSDLYSIEIYKDYKENEPVINPTGADSNLTGQRCLRGSLNFFHQDPWIEYQIQTITRMKCKPDEISEIYGFRIAKMDKSEKEK